ncbi:alpha/beta hydrolase [Nocardioides cynanchi]|uniref:alpha/beta hydrolase n=1 Tax=Nocardioides cynanchi TaxID=2558918 RepID=UPI001246487A|nr:alpha/beta fold hydrolase [Nocardioides cynanchi]
MELAPRLVAVRTPRQPRGVVLVLHGGAARREAVAVSPTQLSVLRMVPIARRVARRRGLAVFRLLNSQRGWGSEDTPLADVRWALAEVRERYGDVPVVLAGHSLGGRAALRASTEPGVVGAVMLNAYLLPGDDRVDPPGRLLFVHGTDDRIASYARARAVAEQLSRRTDVEFRTVEGGKHAMLRHSGTFDRAAADFSAQVLTDDSPALSPAPPDQRGARGTTP